MSRIGKAPIPVPSGVDVTIETCPHYLTRTCYDPDLDMRAKISPPLRDRGADACHGPVARRVGHRKGTRRAGHS